MLDQTWNDLSVRLGMAGEGAFREMLAAAVVENPGADIYVKTHPDVLAGRRRGYFPREVLPPGVTAITEAVSPPSLLRQVDEVYCVTSQMGFEALLAGRPVHCFGMPFYAGWGLTDDRQSCPRRTARRSLEEVFAAAFILYARYVHPVTGRRCRVMDIIRLLTAQRAVNEENRGYRACLGFRLWKHEQPRAFLASTGGEVAFFRKAAAAVAAAKARGGSVVVWSSRETATLAGLCAEAGVPLLRMEDGFVRSRGLGSDFTRPGSLVLDDLGIYYDPGRPSRLERLLASWADGGPDGEHAPLLARARALREDIVRRGVTKYNVGDDADIPALPKGKTVILVPGQVQDDASVRLGGLGIASNLELLRAVRAARPDAYIIYKEHPDVVSRNRAGALRESDVRGLADAFVRRASIDRLYSRCDEVHTLTSQSGFEALLRGLRVVTYGGPFYAGWGLTEDRHVFPRRKRLPSVDALVAAAMLQYPRYYDWAGRCFTDCGAYLDALGGGDRRSFLFLQGPYGPFFYRMACALRAHGCETRRVITCGGDWSYWPEWDSAILWRGRIDQWPAWIAARLEEFRVTDLALLGDWRRLHTDAIFLARQRGIRVWVFEEGYLRPNYVTLELGGVNGWSPLPRDPQTVRERAARYGAAPPFPESRAPNPQPVRVRQIIRHHASTYGLFPLFPHYVTHRSVGSFREALAFVRRYALRRRRTRDSLRTLRAFLGRGVPFYFFPLQLDSDAQIRRHSPFTGVLESIRQVVTSFALHAPADSFLLIKNNPFDNGLIKYRRYMRSLGRTLGCSRRVVFVEAGRIGRIMPGCRGVVLCNSTVGLSALQIGRPVYCLGSAVYAMPGLAVTAKEMSLDRFWTALPAPDMDLVDAFVRLLRNEALLPGNFYGDEGIRDAVAAALTRMGVTGGGDA